MSDQEDTGQLAVRRAGMEHKGDFKPAANLLTQLARGWAAGTAGLPGDLEGLARLAQKYTTLNPAVRALDTTPVLPTSEFYKEWLPGADSGVGGKELNNIGSLFGGVGAGTAASGAVDLGKGALTLASKAARNAAVPRTLSTQAGVIKAPGGNWLSGSVEDALKGLKSGTLYPDPIWLRNNPDLAAVNNWIDKQLTRYVKNDMATERDPVRALAEQGTLHYNPRIAVPGQVERAMERRIAGGFPAGGHGEEELARTYENLTDASIHGPKASDWKSNAPTNMLNNIPGFDKIMGDTPVYERTNPNMVQDLGFDHLVDELRNATNPASGLPRELLLKPESLSRVSMPQAVEHVAKINAWREAQKVAANQSLANNAATALHKDYPDKGFKWVELRTPSAKSVEELTPDQASWYQEYLQGGVSPEKALTEASKRGDKSLADALKYEGDTMGHCVGGYCEDVASGRSRILSLRDAKGQPHVTVEVKPADWYRNEQGELMSRSGGPLGAVKEKPHMMSNSIVQIKGKANLAPNAEYLPFVQDLVRGGLGGDLTNWERVGDLSNAGMVKMGGGVTRYRAATGAPPVEYKMPEGYMTLREAADYLIKQGAPEKWAKQHLGVSLTDGYASGGSVPNNPYTIDAAAFHTAVDPLLGGANMWQAHDDSPQKLALQLGNGATWNVGGGEGTYGSGVYKYDPITEADDKRYQEALAVYNATGLATFNPDSIVVGSGSKADRDNMLESWLGSGGALGALRAGAQGFDTGESGHVEGHAPTAEEWAAALAKDAPGYDPNKPIYRVRGDMSQLLGKPDSRMFLDAGYQEVDGRMVPLGTPSRTYQKSVGAENISMLSALLAPYSVGMALNNAAASGGTAMAQAATEANAANAAQGFGQLGVAGAAPAAGIGEQAIAAYQAAQPYLKAANTVGALARGNPMGALGGYLPGVDLGLGDFGNTVANGAVKAGLSGGNPLLGAVAGAAGEVIPAELRQYLPMAQGLVAATEGKLSLTQALNMLARYNSSSSKGA